MFWIERDSLADVRLTLRWKDSSEIQHTAVHDAFHLNFWRDIFPRTLYQELMGKMAGDNVHLCFEAGAALVGYNPRALFSINNNQFGLTSDADTSGAVHLGRFYPKGILQNVAGIFPQNREPFRCVGIEKDRLMVDFNHPLVACDLSLDAEVRDVYQKTHERGGNSMDWIEVLTNGPGMQSRWRNQPTDFFYPAAFGRTDETPDTKFYAQPRFVNHIDITAREIIAGLYGRLLSGKGCLLDLMSSWVSHLPEHLNFRSVIGLGLNGEELARNPRLNETIVHDLNRVPRLPFEDASIDAIICTASIEYLTDPLEIFKESARVLAPGGMFIITFSNRWFAPKAVNIWAELHEFERMGLILEYFLHSAEFHNLNTFSHRGLPRDKEDKYYDRLAFADPVYAVWATRNQS